jgi:NDP-sugar pyrophosphorylase family protein
MQNSNLNVLFLAAGKGTRLRPITSSKPKPLIELVDDTILGRLLRQFRTYFTDSQHWVNISAFPEKFLQPFSVDAVQDSVRFIWEPNLLGSASTVEFLASQVDGPLLVIHSDLVLSNSYVRSLHRVLDDGGMTDNLIFCHKRAAYLARSSVAINDDYRVISFQSDKSKFESNSGEILVNSGIYFFKSSIPRISNIEVGADVTTVQLPFLIDQNNLSVRLLTEKRIAIDSREMLLLAKQKIVEFDD